MPSSPTTMSPTKVSQEAMAAVDSRTIEGSTPRRGSEVTVAATGSRSSGVRS